MAKKWYMREYQNGDEKGIIEIRKEVFADDEIEKQSFDYWKWEFMDNPNGKAEIMLAFNKEDDLLIGHQAYIQRKFKFFDNILYGALGADTMIRKDYRYPFMLYYMDNQMKENLKNKNIKFNYGFNRRPGIKEITIQLGYEILGTISVYVQPVNSKSIINYYIKNNIISLIIGKPIDFLYTIFRKIKINGLQERKIEISKHFDDSFNDLWDKCSNQFNIMQVRDYENLKWRFEENPKIEYTILKCIDGKELVGYMVLRKAELFGLNCIIICDVLALNKDKNILGSLDKAVTKYAKDNNCDLVGVMMISSGEYYEYFKKYLYIKSPFYFNMYFKNLLSNDRVKHEDFYITWMDSDTI